MSTTCAEVKYVSTSVVLPANPSVTKSTPGLDLTQWDLAFLPFEYIQIGLLFTNPDYGKQSKQEDMNMMVNHLKTSLSRTLDKFFPLAGRLAITKHGDGTISVYINCDSAGAEFIHATADISVADILDPTYIPGIVNSFFSLNGITSYEGLSQPLLSIQVTELNDGVFIGCSMNHCVADGTSFWHFFNSWSEISRGSEHVSVSPILERWFPDNTDCPVRFPFSPLEGLIERNNLLSSVLPNRFFHFTKENIARLKAKANSEMNGHAHHNISSLQALLAHIWIAVTRVRCLDPNEETTYGIAIGNRSRLNPPLPETYFGSPVQLGKATAKVGELLERGLGWAASLFNQVIMSHNDAAIRSSLDAWVRKPVFITVNSNNNTLVPKNMLITGSSPRFNIYTNDFGWGRPVAVLSGVANKSQGKLTVFPGPVEGSMDVEACLSLKTLNALADDSEFMEAVTVLPPFQRV